jgi:hypothetical protein
MWWRHKSFLGLTIYRMHKTWSTCWNGSTVTAIFDRNSWFDETDSIFYDRGISSDWTSGLNTWHATSYRSHHIEYCVLGRQPPVGRSDDEAFRVLPAQLRSERGP